MKAIAANVFTIGIARLVVATAGMAVIVWRRGERLRLPGADRLRLAVIGLFFFLHWWTFLEAVKVSSAAIATIGLSTYGIWLLVLGVLIGRARIHPVDGLSVLLAIFGAIAVVPRFALDSVAVRGLALSCTSALFYASLPLLHQRAAHLSTPVRALGQFAGALVLFLLFLPSANWSFPARDWAGLAFLAVGSTLIAHGLWVKVTTRLPYAMTSIVYYGSVPVALLLSVLLLHEPLAGRTLAGAMLIATGSLLGLSSQWWRGRRVPRTDSNAA